MMERSNALFLVAAVAVRTAFGKGVLTDKIAGAAGFAHGVVQGAKCGSQVGKPQLVHQGANAAGAETGLVAAAIGIGEEIHVPGIGIPVRSTEGGGSLHALYVLGGELALTAHKGEAFHDGDHHGLAEVNGQPVQVGTLGHTQHNACYHGGGDDVQLEAVALFKGWKLADDVLVLALGIQHNGVGSRRG